MGEAAKAGYGAEEGGIQTMNKPYLKELPSGAFEKVYPADWPMPPGPERPNIIRRAEALVAITQGMKAERLVRTEGDYCPDCGLFIGDKEPEFRYKPVNTDSYSVS